MNGIQFAVFVAIIFAALYYIPRAIRHDRNLAAMEALDDEALAAEASEAWSRGEW